MLAAIANACRKQSNFYSITVFLSRSGRSLLVRCLFYVGINVNNVSSDIGEFRLLGSPSCWEGDATTILWSPSAP